MECKSDLPTKISEMENDDLEDGEIESDNDDNKTEEEKLLLTQQQSPIKLTEIIDKKSIIKDVIDDKRISTNSIIQNHLATNDLCGGGGDSFSSSSLTKKQKKNKNQGHQDIQSNPNDDDWMSNVENAIATALKKKDGTEPSFQLNLQKSTKDKTTTIDTAAAPNLTTNTTFTASNNICPAGSSSNSNSNSTSSKSKKRKSREQEKDTRKRLKTTQNDKLYSINQPNQQNDTFIEDYIDEYEMMCVRGGSPPPPAVLRLPHHRHQDNEFGNSDLPLSDDDNDSYSSYDSYEGRRRNHHQRRRRGTSKDKQQHRLNDDNRNKKSMESKRRGRKNDDSDDDRENRSGGIGSSGGAGGGGGGSSNSNAFRKLELCKFYLMGCCAKREKCLYMHSDFPCKYYYLGMKPHDTDQCKFSHGAPLTDQLRNILLKHLETAPKEILGDFPRLSRDTAIGMIQQQHQKLLKQYGANLDTQSSDLNNTINSSPSLSPVTTEIPINYNNKSNEIITKNANSHKKSSNKSSDRKRKTRWRDSSPSNGGDSGGGNNIAVSKNYDNEENDRLLIPPDDEQYVQASKQQNIRLNSLTGIITTIQLERLAEMGVEYVDQINQLTVAQLNKLGLSISQIHEIQLNALNVKPLKINQNKSTKNYHISSTPLLPFTNSNLSLNVGENHVNINSKTDVQIGDFGTPDGQDQDMRIRTDLAIPTNRCHDVDMRIIQPIKNVIETDHSAFDPPTSILNDPAVINYTDYITTDKQTTEFHPPKLDYSQYLKDSNLTNSDLIRTTATNDDTTTMIDSVENDIGNQQSTTNNIDEIDNGKKLSDNYLGNVPMPAVYNPCTLSSTIFPVTITNKIDLSASVTKYLNNTTNISADGADGGGRVGYGDNNDDEYHESNNSNSLLSLPSSFQSRDPRKILSEETTIGDSTKTISRTIKNEKPEIFENHTRQNSEINYTTENVNEISDQSQPFYYQPLAHITSSTTTASSSTTTTITTGPGTAKGSTVLRSSIYELDETTNVNENDYNNKKSGNLLNQYQENDSNNRRDKDMRLLFLSNDYPTGGDDIDLRLPFTPNMANYLPAKEIDGSIGSHAPILYVVKEIDIPRPNYAEIRRTAQMSSLMGGVDEILDPRLRQIFRIIDQQNDDSTMQLHRNNRNFNKQNNEFNNSEIQFSNSDSMSLFMQQSNKFSQRVVDPRCKNKDNISNKLESTILPQKQQQKLNTLSVPSSSIFGLDMQTILRESEWYASLSSKYKIMVNQQLALISTELKKFHQDQSVDKLFDLSLVTQNPLSHQVLTNLGVYINVNGQFIHLANSEILNFMNNPCDFRNNSGGMQKFPNNECDLLLDANTIGNSSSTIPISRFGNSGIYGSGNIPNNNIGNNIRPGLLGIAPGIPCNNMYDNIDNNMGNICDPGGGNFDNQFSNNYGGDSGGDGMDPNMMYFHSQNRQSGLNQNIDRLRYDDGSLDIGGNQNEVGLRGRQGHSYKSTSGRGTFIRSSSSGSGSNNNNRNTNRRNNYDGRDRNSSRKNI